MPFWRLYYHLVWAVKNRGPVISEERAKRLYPYLVHKASELGVFVYAANGWLDHVHLIVAIPPNLSVAEVVQRLKGATSHELNRTGELEGAFAWQRGYGALSLGQKQLSRAVEYVLSQGTHHETGAINAWLERNTDLDEGPSQDFGGG